MKKNILFTFLLFGLFACDQGGLITQVPATGTFNFNVDSEAANASANRSLTNEGTIDPADLVNESAELSKSISLTKFTYGVSGYVVSSTVPVVMNLSVSTRIDGATHPLLSVSGMPLIDGVITAFEKDNEASVLTAAQVPSLEALMENQGVFDLIVTAGCDNNLESYFTIDIVWYLIASVEFPQT
jgi:hypothetical protein